MTFDLNLQMTLTFQVSFIEIQGYRNKGYVKYAILKFDLDTQTWPQYGHIGFVYRKMKFLATAVQKLWP